MTVASIAGPLICVVGARPNYMKMAPLLRAIRAEPRLPKAVLVHTGQHYDPALNDRLFSDLDLPTPDVNLEVGSGSHAVQTAEVMKRFEPVVVQYEPSAVIVVGDVNSTMACTLVAAKLHVACSTRTAPCGPNKNASRSRGNVASSPLAFNTAALSLV